MVRLVEFEQNFTIKKKEEKNSDPFVNNVKRWTNSFKTKQILLVDPANSFEKPEPHEKCVRGFFFVLTQVDDRVYSY